MKAASVVSFGSPPEFVEQPAPSIVGADNVLLDVLAVGLHPIVRAQADGTHYMSPQAVPFTPGIDGVGQDGDGVLYYFILFESKYRGAMAEQVVVNTRHIVPLPPDADPVAVAATMNPAMSAWLALRGRTQFRAGQDVLVLGATGNSGRMAVRIAALLGARKVIAAGRDSGRLAELPALGATDVVAIGDPELLGATAADVDVVLDYVWGTPTAAIMAAIAAHRRDPGHKLTWVEIGSAAGPHASLPSAALRSCHIDIVGSGRGALSTDTIVAGLADLAAPVAVGDLIVEAEARPLADVAQSWQDASRLTARIVLLPGRTTPNKAGART